MRRIRSALLVLLTAALMAGGAVLPYVTSRIQDRYLEEEQELRTFDPVGLRLGDEPAAWPALSVVAGDHEWMGWDGETNLDRDDARGAAREAMRRMAEAGLTSSVLSHVSMEDMWAEPTLMVSGSSRGLSAIIWNVSWNFDDEEFHFCDMLIDDSTGKMVRVIFNTPRFKVLEDVYAQRENWRVFLEEYYGLEEIVYLDEERFDDDMDYEYFSEKDSHSAASAGSLERRFLLEFDLGEELGRHKIQLQLLDRIASFN